MLDLCLLSILEVIPYIKGFLVSKSLSTEVACSHTCNLIQVCSQEGAVMAW